MSKNTISVEAQEVRLASELIELGARMQVLEAETNLSRDKLIRLYKELKGVSPPKGMLPFSTDWYMTWLPNVHSTVFYNIYRFLRDTSGLAHIDALTRAYRLYLEQARPYEDEPQLSLTRAWTLIRYFEADLLQLTPCTRCKGKFVAHRYAPTQGYVCGLCQPPSRAGQTKAAKERKVAQQSAA